MACLWLGGKSREEAKTFIQQGGVLPNIDHFSEDCNCFLCRSFEENDFDEGFCVNCDKSTAKVWCKRCQDREHCDVCGGVLESGSCVGAAWYKD